jgi:hypothetical protein
MEETKREAERKRNQGETRKRESKSTKNKKGGQTSLQSV